MSIRITNQPAHDSTGHQPGAPDYGLPPLHGRLQSHALLIAAACAAAMIAMALVLFTPRYETNDDVMMNLIAAGQAFVDGPDEHLLFINVLLGLPLRWLYAHAPNVPWYGIGQLAALFAAATALGYAMLRANPSRRQLVVVVLFLGVAFLPCVTQMQYTKTAFFVSLAGLLLFVAPLHGPRPWSTDVAAGSLLVLGALIRFSSFLMAGVIATPLAIAAIASAPGVVLRRAPRVGLALAVVAGGYVINREYYVRDPEWRGYHAYYAARSEFTDYDRVEYSPRTSSAFEAIGWDRVDLDMLMTWFFADRERYRLDNLRYLLESARSVDRPTLGESAVVVVESLVKTPALQQLTLAALSACVLAGNGWRRFLLAGVLFGLAFAVAVTLRSYMWLPPRVLVSLFAGVVAGVGISAITDAHSSKTGVARPVAVAARALAGLLAVGLVVRTLIGVADEDSYRGQLNAAANRMLTRLKPRPDQLFVVWREQFPFEELVAPLQSTAALGSFQCLSLSCLLDTPFTERRLQKFHVEDLYRALWERPDVLLATHPELCDFLHRYAKAHYGVELSFPVVFTNREPFVYIVRPREMAPSAAEKGKGDGAGNRR
jgi:hypothetical protein